MKAQQALQSPKQLERVAHTLHPGEWAVERERPLATLLGSCVAVCLFDPRLRCGGMNHFLLPSGPTSRADDPDIVLAGDFAMEVLVNALLARGASKRRLVAKVFGGANVTLSGEFPIGERNARFARDWLAREGIPLLAHDLGGRWPRKIVFLPWNGDAYCRRQVAHPPSMDALRGEERNLQRRVDDGLGTSPVELY